MITGRNEKQCQYRGLLSDRSALDTSKLANGSTFLDLSSGDEYMFDAENKTWYKMTSTSAGLNDLKAALGEVPDADLFVADGGRI